MDEGRRGTSVWRPLNYIFITTVYDKGTFPIFLKFTNCLVHGAAVANISVAAMQIPFAGIKLNECFVVSFLLALTPTIHSVGCSRHDFFPLFSGSQRQFIRIRPF